MAQKFKKILAFSMALTVLVSSHSFAYFEHLCTITQTKKLSFHLETCAGDVVEATPSNATTLHKGACCEITYKVNKADNAVQHTFNLAFSPFWAEEIAFPVFEFQPETTILSERPALNHGDSSPPLLLPLYLLNEQFII
ncbi:MAG: hypothetical protein LRY55_06990 [Leadbetterella sp.]|nr:hypothetical protein [Leadbetterella sp.]